MQLRWHRLPPPVGPGGTAAPVYRAAVPIHSKVASAAIRDCQHLQLARTNRICGRPWQSLCDPCGWFWDGRLGPVFFITVLTILLRCLRASRVFTSLALNCWPVKKPAH